MPRYEFRCRECGERFAVDRPMAQAGEPAACPEGHDDTVKLMTSPGLGGRTGAGAKSSMSASRARAIRPGGHG